MNTTLQELFILKQQIAIKDRLSDADRVRLTELNAQIDKIMGREVSQPTVLSKDELEKRQAVAREIMKEIRENNND